MKFRISILKLINQHIGLFAFAAMLIGLVLGIQIRLYFLKHIVPIALFFMLFPSMLETRIQDITGVFKKPKIMIFALVINFFVCPLFIILLIHAFNLDKSPALVIGLLLYASTPCGGMVPSFTGMLYGNVGLSISITTTSLIASILFVPMWVWLYAGDLIGLPYILVAKYLLFIVIIPFSFAQLTRQISSRYFSNCDFIKFVRKVKSLSGVGLMLLCFIMFCINGETIVEHPKTILSTLIPVSAFLVTMIIGITMVCIFTDIREADAIALIISCSAKNNALALAVAFSMIGNEVALINTIAGPLIQLPIMVNYIRFRDRLLNF